MRNGGWEDYKYNFSAAGPITSLTAAADAHDGTDDYANAKTPTPEATAAVPPTSTTTAAVPLTATTNAADPRPAASQLAPATVVHQATAKDNSAKTNAESVNIIARNAAKIECNPHSKCAVGATEFELDAFILMLCFL